VHNTETFRLPERQVASTMISVLAGTEHLSARGGGKASKGREETP